MTMKVITIVFDDEADTLEVNWQGLNRFEAKGMIEEGYEMLFGAFDAADEDID